MIIDVHAHIGQDYIFDEDFTAQEQLDKHRDHQVDITIVQPGTCHDIESVREQHNNTGTELAKVRTCGLTAEEQAWILHQSALSVYHLGR